MKKVSPQHIQQQIRLKKTESKNTPKKVRKRCKGEGRRGASSPPKMRGAERPPILPFSGAAGAAGPPRVEGRGAQGAGSPKTQPTSQKPVSPRLRPSSSYLYHLNFRSLGLSFFQQIFIQG